MLAQIAALVSDRNTTLKSRKHRVEEDNDLGFEDSNNIDIDIEDIDTDDEFVQPARTYARIGKLRFRPN